MLLIGLLWHSTSSDNLGVGALTESQIAIIRQAAVRAGVEVKFRVFGTTGGMNYFAGDLQLETGVPISIKRTLAGISPFPSQIGQCDVVFDIGEGDSFTDIYGMARLRMQVFAKSVALLKGRPLVLSPQTIGPFERPVSRLMAHAVIRRCRRVFARDGLSFGYLREHGLTAHADEVVDVAFRLPFQRPQRSAGERLQVGINVSGLLYNGGYTGANELGLSLDYTAMTRQMIERLLARGDCDVWLVPHVLAHDLPVEDDYLVSQRLQQDYPALRLAPRFGSPSEAKSFISGMDFFTGARMHACIAAFSSGVPVVPLAYSRKFNGLFTALEYPHYGDCKAATTEQILDLVFKGLEQRAELKQAVDRGNAIADIKLRRYEDFVEQTLRNLRGKTTVA
ncbi:Polysaccharide pyruvyl transferase family protein WcaK [Duganella sacchari]|uniref:Polysaccharide pyruvyl transferase family protein WcaK n=1 Tax=Duganella sacchari TaxID=551987 RepID=A0A1M7R066_9BURK|nr:polysaccharide pyruvyl transferase family protein [Duganella sacchari]SHN38050.1 Polysaccharide pyruvyl transferase family protein WcaK [Duganella sacchari]